MLKTIDSQKNFQNLNCEICKKSAPENPENLVDICTKHDSLIQPPNKHAYHLSCLLEVTKEAKYTDSSLHCRICDEKLCDLLQPSQQLKLKEVTPTTSSSSRLEEPPSPKKAYADIEEMLGQQKSLMDYGERVRVQNAQERAELDDKEALELTITAITSIALQQIGGYTA